MVGTVVGQGCEPRNQSPAAVGRASGGPVSNPGPPRLLCYMLYLGRTRSVICMSRSVLPYCCTAWSAFSARGTFLEKYTLRSTYRPAVLIRVRGSTAVLLLTTLEACHPRTGRETDHPQDSGIARQLFRCTAVDMLVLRPIAEDCWSKMPQARPPSMSIMHNVGCCGVPPEAPRPVIAVRDSRRTIRAVPTVSSVAVTPAVSIPPLSPPLPLAVYPLSREQFQHQVATIEYT